MRSSGTGIKRLRNYERVDGLVARTGMEIPVDIRHGSHGWRAYLYAILLKGQKATTEDKAALIDLHRSISREYRMPWSRRRIIPLDESRFLEILDALMHTVWTTDSADVLRACLWQIGALRDGECYTDDHVAESVPPLEKFFRTPKT